MENPEGFYALFEDIMLNILKMGTLIVRIDPEGAMERDHYTVSLYYYIIISNIIYFNITNNKYI